MKVLREDEMLRTDEENKKAGMPQYGEINDWS